MKTKKIMLLFFALISCIFGAINANAETGDCKYSDAKICEHKSATVNLVTYYIEYGYTNNNYAYFGVTTNNDYSGLNVTVLPLMTNSGNVKVGYYTFQIQNKSANLIFLSNNKLVDPSFITVSIENSLTGGVIDPFLVNISAFSKCSYPKAEICERRTVKVDLSNYYIEYGYEPNNYKPYLLVSNEFNFQSYNYYVLPLMYERGELSVTTKDSLYNFIIPEDRLELIFLSGNALASPDMLSITRGDNVTDNNNIYIRILKNDELPGADKEENVTGGESSCESLLGHPEDKGTPAYYMVFVFDIMKYVAIIILIVFTIIDFSSAIPSQDNDIIKKTAQKALKRLIICIIIFILPTLISLLLGLMDKIPNDMCGIK